jgi:hypothetical protein
MAVKLNTSSFAIDGTIAAEGGSEDSRTVGATQVTRGTLKTARGRLVLAEDGETVLFVADDPEALEAVVAADEA